jgi:hypothetical protein
MRASGSSLSGGWKVFGALGLVALATFACTRTNFYGQNNGNGLTSASAVPTPTPTPTPAAIAVQFRVLGNPNSVRIHYSTPADGLVQVVGSLPWENGFTWNARSVFLTLDATPLVWLSVGTSPFLSVQIIVNGSVFREAALSDFSFTTLAVSGTYTVQ